MAKIYLLNFSLFFLIQVFSQTEHVQIKKEINLSPSIGGLQYGDIPYYLLCSEKGITSFDSLEITSFRLQYTINKGDQSVLIRGNRIPDTICAQIANSGIGYPIFFTEIIAVNRKKRMKYIMLPMNFMIIEEQ